MGCVNECGACTAVYETKELAVEAWNLRTAPDNMTDRIEELEAEIVRLEAALKNIRDVAEISDGPQWYAMIADNALTGEGDNIQPERFDEYGHYGENNPPVGSRK